MGKTIGENISKNLSDKYSQKLLDNLKQSATDALKTTSKREIQKTAEAIDDLIGNKMLIKLRWSQKTSQQNNSKTVTNEHGKCIAKERYISPEERQKDIDDLRLM